jgi:hypothetical protein
MTEHVPECWATHESDPPAWCICDELRACENRVCSNVRAEAVGEGCTWHTPPCPNGPECLSCRYLTGCIEERRKGYGEGLLAAAEAVGVALPHEDYCKGAARRTCNCSRFEALEAIRLQAAT